MLSIVKSAKDIQSIAAVASVNNHEPEVYKDLIALVCGISKELTRSLLHPQLPREQTRAKRGCYLSIGT